MNNNQLNASCSPEQAEFIRRYRRHVLLIHLLRITILIVFLVTWELLARFNIIDSFIFSCPSKLVAAARKYMASGLLPRHIKITLIETIACFSIVIGLSMLIAIILWWHRTIYLILEPYLVVLNALPKSALAPLFIVWLGTGMNTIIVAAVSVAIFGAILSLYEHFIETDTDQINLVYSLGGSKYSVLTKVVLPSNLAFIVNTIKVNLGLSLVGVIIGEFVAARAGLGYLILYASQIFKLDLVILSIIILAIIASLFYLILDLIEKRITRK